MSFQWASMLWLLFVLPVLVLLYLWAQRRRKKFAVRYASLMLVKDALGKGPGFRRHIPAVLFLLGVAIGILALARPLASISLPSNRGTVILAIDISGSMRAQDIAPSRMEAAKEAARSFVEKQPPRVRIGVVAFSGTSDLVQAPTTSRTDILAAIDRLRTQRGTAIGSGILVSLDAIFEDTQPQQPSTPGVGDPLVPTVPAPDPPPVPRARTPRLPSCSSPTGRATRDPTLSMLPRRQPIAVCGYSPSASEPHRAPQSGLRAGRSGWVSTRRR